MLKPFSQSEIATILEVCKSTDPGNILTTANTEVFILASEV